MYNLKHVGIVVHNDFHKHLWKRIEFCLADLQCSKSWLGVRTRRRSITRWAYTSTWRRIWQVRQRTSTTKITLDISVVVSHLNSSSRWRHSIHSHSNIIIDVTTRNAITTRLIRLLLSCLGKDYDLAPDSCLGCPVTFVLSAVKNVIRSRVNVTHLNKGSWSFSWFTPCKQFPLLHPRCPLRTLNVCLHICVWMMITILRHVLHTSNTRSAITWPFPVAQHYQAWIALSCWQRHGQRAHVSAVNEVDANDSGRQCQPLVVQYSSFLSRSSSSVFLLPCLVSVEKLTWPMPKLAPDNCHCRSVMHSPSVVPCDEQL